MAHDTCSYRLIFTYTSHAGRTYLPALQIPPPRVPDHSRDLCRLYHFLPCRRFSRRKGNEDQTIFMGTYGRYPVFPLPLCYVGTAGPGNSVRPPPHSHGSRNLCSQRYGRWNGKLKEPKERGITRFRVMPLSFIKLCTDKIRIIISCCPF